MKFYIFFFLALIFYSSGSSQEITLNPNDYYKVKSLLVDRTNQLVELLEVGTKSLNIEKKELRKFSPFDIDKLKKLRFYDDLIEPMKEKPIEAKRYVENLGFFQSLAFEFDNIIKYDKLITIDASINKNNAIAAATIINPKSDKIRAKVKDGLIISSFIKRKLNGQEEGSDVLTIREDYINIAWFINPNQKKGKYNFSSLSGKDLKLVGYGFVDANQVHSKDVLWRDSWNSQKQKEAKEKALSFIRDYIRDHNKLKDYPTLNEKVLKYFASPNMEIRHYSPQEAGAAYSSSSKYLTLVNDIKHKAKLKNSIPNVFRDADNLNHPYVVIKTQDSIFSKNNICVTNRNITVSFDYEDGDLSNPRITGIIFSNGEKPNIECSKTKTDPDTTSPPRNTFSNDYMQVVEALRLQVRNKLQTLHNGIKAKSKGEEVDLNNIQSLFLNKGKNTKIRVTNHSRNIYEIYDILGYFEHLEALRKQYSKISFDFLIDELEVLPGSLNGTWIAKTKFTQTFYGKGQKSYCDEMEKTVDLVIRKETDGYMVYIKDIWHKNTRKIPCP